MTVDKFWKIVDRVNAASEGDMDEKCSLLKSELEKLSAEEVASFQSHFDDAMDRAYTWPLWAAAYIMNGGCSDDSFMDFRATLISMGQKTFEKVLADPESLADIGPEDGEEFIYEGYQYAPAEVLEEIRRIRNFRARKRVRPSQAGNGGTKIRWMKFCPGWRRNTANRFTSYSAPSATGW